MIIILFMGSYIELSYTAAHCVTIQYLVYPDITGWIWQYVQR